MSLIRVMYFKRFDIIFCFKNYMTSPLLVTAFYPSQAPHFEPRKLSYDDLMSFGGMPGRPAKYSFLSKLSSWSTQYTKARKAGNDLSERPEPLISR